MQVAAHSATLLGYVDGYIEDAPTMYMIRSGHNAARVTMDLTLRTFHAIPPLALADTYANGGVEALWNKYTSGKNENIAY